MEFRVYLSPSVLGFCLVGACTGLLHAIAVNSFVHLPFVSGRQFPWCYPLALVVFLSPRDLWALWGGRYISLRTEYSSFLFFCMLSSGVALLSAICCNKLLWWEVRGALIYGYSMALGGIFILRPLRRIIVLGSSIGPLTYPVTDSWLLSQYWAWVTSHGVDLGTVRKWLTTPTVCRYCISGHVLSHPLL